MKVVYLSKSKTVLYRAGPFQCSALACVLLKLPTLAEKGWGPCIGTVKKGIHEGKDCEASRLVVVASEGDAFADGWCDKMAGCTRQKLKGG